MTLGTAKITERPLINADGTLFTLWVVNYRNVGSCLQPTPRGFGTKADALAFCRERSLQVKH